MFRRNLSLVLFLISCSTLAQQPTEPETDDAVNENIDSDPQLPITATQPPEDPPPRTFTGEGELGYIMTSGNSETVSLNSKISLAYEKNKWKQSASLQSKKTEDSGSLTADSNIFTTKTNYTFSQRTYTFGSFRYEEDAFSGFAFQRSLTAGIGWHLLDNETTLLDIEAGAGSKESETDLNENIDESIARFFGQFNHKLSENTTLAQELLIEGGDENTRSHSISSLKVSMTDKLAFKLTYDIKRNSNPPLDRLPEDRTTSVTLVYGF